MTTPIEVPEPLLKHIRGGHRFLLTSHAHPDGDAIGSALGLARILRQLGKGATIWNLDRTPTIYQPLPGSRLIHVGEEPPAGFPDLFDAVIVLECPSPERTGLESALTGQKLINIDHHLGNEQYGEINWVDTSAPAVGEMIFRIARALKLSLDADTATLLYLTLVTDTGGFRFSNTSANTFEAAAALVNEGASAQRVSQWLYESQPVGVMRLLGEMLRTLELHHEGRVATAWLTHEMFTNAGAAEGDSEGLIDYPRSIAGVEAVALFRQLDDNRFKVSLRSRDGVNVEKIARRFGGGGHQNAAGFSTDGERQAVFEQAVEALTEALG